MPASSASAIETPKTTVRPWWKGPEMRCGKNSRPVITARFCGRKVLQRACRGEQVLQRVDAEDRREQRRHRRQRADVLRGGVRHALLPAAPGRARRAGVRARPATISEKNTPIDSAVPEFWNVARMPDATPRSLGRDAAHDRGGVRRGEHTAADPVERDQQRERPVREVDRQQQQADEARAEQQHAGRRRSRARRTGPTGARAAGPATRNPAVSGSRKMPAHSGVSA